MQKLSFIKHGIRQLQPFSLLLAIAAILFTPATSKASSAPWTFMVYMAADNNLSSAAVEDIEEMRQASAGANINIIVQVELSPIYTFRLPGYLADYTTWRLHIHNGTIHPASAGGNLDMASAGTLAEFIRWSASNWPASNYALTIWDHGNGWKAGAGTHKGAVQDDTSRTRMNIGQIAAGISQSHLHLDVLNFDACLMGMIEVAYEMRNSADYIVFSQATEPTQGDPYLPMLRALADSPAMDGATLAASMVNTFADYYTALGITVTKSAVDASLIEPLSRRLTDFAVLLTESMPSRGPAIILARDKAQHFSTQGFIDLVSFLQNLGTLEGALGSSASELAEFVTSGVVIANRTFSASYTGFLTNMANPVDDAHGLSIYLPSDDNIESGDLDRYREISFALDAPDGWPLFLTRELEFSNGDFNHDHTHLVKGEFACGAAWFNSAGQWGDADVDLYIIEPDGTIGSPWHSQSTFNGYFSLDSADSGDSYEIYTSKPEVQPGNYFMVINYVSPGARDNHAMVGVYYMDFLNGINFWTPLLPGLHIMGMWNPAPETWDENVITGIILGYYSDWWIPGNWITRSDSPSLDAQIRALAALAPKAGYKRNLPAIEQLIKQLSR